MMAANWSRRLTRRIKPTDGPALVTLADARAYALTIGAERETRQAWQHAAEMMIAAAQGGSIAAATDQIELALFLDLRLDLGSG